MQVLGGNTGGWIVGQQASQFINMNGMTTTVGIGGSLASSAQFNTVTLICTSAPNGWTVLSSEGVLTVT